MKSPPMKMCHPAIIDQDFSPTSTTSCQQQPKQKKNVLTELLMVLNRTAIVIINIEDQSPTPAMLAILTSFQTRHVVRLLHPDNPSEEREREGSKWHHLNNFKEIGTGNGSPLQSLRPKSHPLSDALNRLKIFSGTLKKSVVQLPRSLICFMLRPRMLAFSCIKCFSFPSGNKKHISPSFRKRVVRIELQYRVPN